MVLEITSFGTLSKLYKNLKSSKEKQEIANFFGLLDKAAMGFPIDWQKEPVWK
jgi:abortive infection bacteriophage resistance protein